MQRTNYSTRSIFVPSLANAVDSMPALMLVGLGTRARGDFGASIFLGEALGDTGSISHSYMSSASVTLCTVGPRLRLDAVLLLLVAVVDAPQQVSPRSGRKGSRRVGTSALGTSKGPGIASLTFAPLAVSTQVLPSGRLERDVRA